MASPEFDIYAFDKRFGEMSIDPAAECDKQWWKKFLKPLNDRQNKPEPNTIRLNPQLTDESLVGRFIERLEKQHSIKTEEKKQAVASAERNLNEILRRCCIDRDLENMQKAYEDAKNIKSHRESSGSTWTVEMLASYVRRQDVEFTQLSPVLPGGEAEELIKKILEKIDISVEAIGGQLRTECDTRMVLDAILHPLCVKYEGLTIRTEQTLTCDSLPTSKPDYIMYYYDQPIGVVEAKRAGYLIDKSVVQLILQLLSVSAIDPSLPYFGIVSDGRLFVYLVVCANKVRFFQGNQNQLVFIGSDHFMLQRNIDDVVCALLALIHYRPQTRQ